MRKILIFITALALALNFPASAAGQTRYDENESGAGLIGTFEGGGSYDISPIDWFKRTFEIETYPKDIYNLMHEQVKAKPKSAALKRVLEKSGLTEDEKQALTGGKDISLFEGPWIINTLGGYLSYPFREEPQESTDKYISRGLGVSGADQKGLRDKIEALQKEYDVEKEISQMEAEMESEITSAEIFANGDTGDSGFDLLYDLNVIHLILFGEPAYLLGGAGPGAPAGAAEINVGSLGEEPGISVSLAKKAKKKVISRKGGAGREQAAGEEQGASAQAGAEAGEAAAEPSSIFSPEQCYSDNDLEKAVENYESLIDPAAEQAGIERGGDAEGGQGRSGGAGGRQRSGAGTGQGGSSGETGEEEEIQPAQASDWSRENPCNSFFCLIIEARMKTESSRPPTANCIACHVEKINDAYAKTVRRNLIPAKAAGNLLEMPRCKAGFSLPDFMNLNVVLLPSPILTPPNDDFVIKSDPFKAIAEFWKKYQPFLAREKTIGGSGNERKVIEEEPMDVLDMASKYALSHTTDRTSIAAVTGEINSFVAGYRNQGYELEEKDETVARAADYGMTYRALLEELTTLKAYFESFKQMFDNMKIPCAKLAGKENCQ